MHTGPPVPLTPKFTKFKFPSSPQVQVFHALGGQFGLCQLHWRRWAARSRTRGMRIQESIAQVRILLASIERTCCTSFISNVPKYYCALDIPWDCCSVDADGCIPSRDTGVDSWRAAIRCFTISPCSIIAFICLFRLANTSSRDSAIGMIILSLVMPFAIVYRIVFISASR